jgi:hypothetical protein
LLPRKVIISSWCYTMVEIRQRQAPKTMRNKNYKFISATTQIDVALSFTYEVRFSLLESDGWARTQFLNFKKMLTNNAQHAQPL